MRERETINDGIDHCCPARGESIDWYCLLCVSTIFGVFSHHHHLFCCYASWRAHAHFGCCFWNDSFTMLGSKGNEKNYCCCCVAFVLGHSVPSTTICKTRLPLQVFLNWYTARGCNTITGTTNKHMLDFLYFLWFFVFLYDSGREEIRINILRVFLLRLTRGTRQFEVDALTDDKILENNSKTCLGSW